MSPRAIIPSHPVPPPIADDHEGPWDWLRGLAPQVPEEFVLDGEPTTMEGFPNLSGKLPERDVVIVGDSPAIVCSRGYVGTWEIRNGWLYLIGVRGRFRPLTAPLAAKWFSGVLRIATGVEHQHAHIGVECRHEVLVRIEDGREVRRITVDPTQCPRCSGVVSKVGPSTAAPMRNAASLTAGISVLLGVAPHGGGTWPGLALAWACAVVLAILTHRISMAMLLVPRSPVQCLRCTYVCSRWSYLDKV